MPGRKRKRGEQKLLKVTQLPDLRNKPEFKTLSKTWGVVLGGGDYESVVKIDARPEEVHQLLFDATFGGLPVLGRGFFTPEAHLKTVEDKQWWLWAALSCLDANTPPPRHPNTSPFDCLNDKGAQGALPRGMDLLLQHRSLQEVRTVPSCIQLYGVLGANHLRAAWRGILSTAVVNSEGTHSALSIIRSCLQYDCDTEGFKAILACPWVLAELAALPSEDFARFKDTEWNSIKNKFVASPGDLVHLLFTPCKGPLATLALEVLTHDTDVAPSLEELRPTLLNVVRHVEGHGLAPEEYFDIKLNSTFVVNTMTPDKLNSPAFVWFLVSCYLSQGTPFVASLLHFIKTSPVATPCVNIIFGILKEFRYKATEAFLLTECTCGRICESVLLTILECGYMSEGDFCEGVSSSKTKGTHAVDTILQAWTMGKREKGNGDNVRQAAYRLWSVRWWKEMDLKRFEEAVHEMALCDIGHIGAEEAAACGIEATVMLTAALPQSVKWLEQYTLDENPDRSECPSPLGLTFDLLLTATLQPKLRTWCVDCLLWNTKRTPLFPIGSDNTEYKLLLVCCSVVLMAQGLGPLHADSLLTNVLDPLLVQLDDDIALCSLLVRCIGVVTAASGPLFTADNIIDLCIFPEAAPDSLADSILGRLEQGSLVSFLATCLIGVEGQTDDAHADALQELCALALAVPSMVVGLALQTYIQELLRRDIPGMREHVVSCLSFCVKTLENEDEERDEVRFLLTKLLDNIAPTHPEEDTDNQDDQKDGQNDR